MLSTCDYGGQQQAAAAAVSGAGAPFSTRRTHLCEGADVEESEDVPNEQRRDERKGDDAHRQEVLEGARVGEVVLSNVAEGQARYKVRCGGERVTPMGRPSHGPAQRQRDKAQNGREPWRRVRAVALRPAACGARVRGARIRRPARRETSASCTPAAWMLCTPRDCQITQQPRRRFFAPAPPAQCYRATSTQWAPPAWPWPRS